MNAVLRNAALALVAFAAAAHAAPAHAAPEADHGVLEAIDAARADSPAVAEVFASPADFAARLDLAERRLAAPDAEGPEATIARAEIASGALHRVLRPAPSRVADLVAHAAR